MMREELDPFKESQEQLDHARFPLGELTKPPVREVPEQGTQPGRMAPQRGVEGISILNIPRVGIVLDPLHDRVVEVSVLRQVRITGHQVIVSRLFL
jgi:hypothetical protein